MNDTTLKYAESIKRYIREHVEQLLKEPRSFIRYPFIDPGSVYDGNVWDWDTYWSVYGLLSMMEEFPEELQKRILLHAKGNVQNFMDHQLEDGYIPMMIEVGEWPEPYLNGKHKDGVLMNMHKPFLCQQILLISRYLNDYSWAAGYREGLKRYFDCYEKNYYMEDKGLFVWRDDIMIGMDNDPASFGRPKFSTANIFLNTFMVQELFAYAELLRKLPAGPGDDMSVSPPQTDVSGKDVTLKETAMEKTSASVANAALEEKDWMETQAQRREQQALKEAGHREEQAVSLAEAIQSECWDDRDKFYYSVDVDIKTRSFDWFHQGLGVFWKTLPVRIRVWSGFLPMFAGISTRKQAWELVKEYHREETFHCPYGVTTLAKNEKMFNLEATNNPSNWLGPVWVVANYVVFSAMLRYGYRQEAEEICENTVRLLGMDLEKTGCMHEYYNPFTGEPVMNGGFVNWNILAVSMVKELEII